MISNHKGPGQWNDTTTQELEQMQTFLDISMGIFLEFNLFKGYSC